ncbi:ABC1 kinase family protein [Propionispora hippei]|uniref:2-octaprenylphenol hydroxylase n=1 Tax=Propionispora hippei DSM 15287 TaxID=1123003 RepID=A0A1M6MAS5_9FIRM|nr:AarF/ABC1/UbiB kinase family protein [Propionispora hippei]SHJ80542.1 2-octaprenylphenol hydroxylase [Propionispora hippei DSM 15287]
MFGKRMRHINRYREIAVALLNQGFDYIVVGMGLPQAIPGCPRSAVTKDNNSGLGERIRLLLEQLGPTYVKLGQIASTRPDLLPAEIIAELEKLQDNVPGFPFSEVRILLREDLGAALEERFSQFDPEPLAAASIGQVHRAQLKTGQQVAVKIQRPGIIATIETDLEILQELAYLAERRFSWAATYQLTDIIDELAKSLRTELDYTIEARHAEKFSKFYQENPSIYIPPVYWEYSSQKVLTSAYVEGIKINDLEQLKQQGYNCSRIAEHFAKEIFQQIFIEGFFHGDPHPGNVLVLPGERIAFLDFGMVGRLNPEKKYHLASLVIGLMRQNSEELTKTIFRMGIVPAEVNRAQLRDDIDLLREKYYGVPLSQISLGTSINQIFATAQKHKIRMPADLALVGKTLLTMEGIAEKLDPQISILTVAEPFGKKLLRERLHPVTLGKLLWHTVNELREVVLNLPDHVQELRAVVKQGRLHLEINVPDIEPSLKTLERISNRLSFGIILLAFSMIMASIIISSSLAGQASPLWNIPVLEIGFSIAVILFLWLLYAILRSGKL